MTLLLRGAPAPPNLDAPWDAPAWAGAETVELDQHRSEGSGHRPRTRARLLWTPEALCGIFRVDDRWVRCVHTGFGQPVYRDSCVELFLEPPGGVGYWNFEWNAGGAMLASRVTDPTRTPEGLKAAAPLNGAEARSVGIRASLPAIVDPELAGPLTWTLAFALPFRLFAGAGAAPPSPGDVWRGNLYKCGDATSHPHWVSWAPLPERNFHLPASFGALRFE